MARRIEALARLHEAGIRTWVFFGPALPVFSDSEQAIDALFANLAQVGVSRVLVDTINLRGAQWGRLRRVLQDHFPEAVNEYQLIQQDPAGYRTLLAKSVARAAERHGVPHELCF